MNNYLLPVSDEANSFFKWGHELAKCPFYKKIGAGGIIAILLTARELGLPMMGCLNGGLYHIDGKVTLSAQMMNLLILQAGHKIDIIESTEQNCTIRFQRKDRSDPVEYSYTVEEAKTAGYLKKDNWRFHLKDMLFCRALSGGARKICPDALLGCYVQGEMNSEEVVQYENISAPHNEEIEEIEEAKNEEQKCLTYQSFCEKHNLNKDSLKDKYIKEISVASGKSEQEIISIAQENEELFSQKFLKWTEDQDRQQ